MPGERRFGDRLRELLEDDYLCWYDVPVGPKHQHPDFLVLHPGRGLLVLEVKDWTLKTLRDADPVRCTIDTGAGLKVVANPLEQARQYTFAVTEVLKRDPQLINPAGSRYEGQLVFPYGYGVVLTNITRSQFESAGLDEVLQAHLVICKDEMTESADAETFQSRLWGMFNVRFDSKLTLPQVERIRWILFPEIRIHQTTLPMESEDHASVPIASADLLQVMDFEQEEVARNLGEGHRIIHGVAGSGKTLILAWRARHLVRTLHKPVLVLVFNRTLAAWLRHQFDTRGVTRDRVTVRTFHSWCADQLRLYHIPVPPGGSYESMVQSVIHAVERGQIPRAQYGAVLIDEGHDFAPEWLKLAVAMLDPVTNHLLLLYDDAQSIYGGNHAKFSFRSVGIAAAGRTKILKRNYRNTREILTCASAFAKDLLTPVDADEDGVPLLQPESGGRTGVRPRFVQVASARLEAQQVGRELLAQHAQGVPWSEMGVFYTAPFVAEEIAAALDDMGVPYDWLKDAAARQFNPLSPTVKLMTPHSSKGLQYRVGIIAGVGFWPFRSEVDEARLLYVAMTRATHELVLTSSKASRFSDRIRALCA